MTLTSIVIMRADHAYISGSHTSGMMEDMSLRYAGIEWFYIEVNIKYDGDWSRPMGYNQQKQ